MTRTHALDGLYFTFVLGGAASAMLLPVTLWAIVPALVMIFLLFALPKIEDADITFFSVLWGIFPRGNYWLYTLLIPLILIIPVVIFCLAFMIGILLYGITISTDTFAVQMPLATNYVAQNEEVVNFMQWGMGAAMNLSRIFSMYTVISFWVDVMLVGSGRDPRP